MLCALVMPGEPGAVGSFDGDGSGALEAFGVGVARAAVVDVAAAAVPCAFAVTGLLTLPALLLLPSLPAARDERKASACPSGDQRGELEDCALKVN